jgi:hypothetical protein
MTCNKRYCVWTLFCFHFLSFQIMSSLGFLERTFGSLNSWSRDVLRYLFLVTPPTSHTTLQLAAFFFGNCIPLLIDIDPFHECCDPSPDLIDLFHRQYKTWGQRHDLRNMYNYCDTRLGQLAALSGSDYDQRVVVETQFPITTGSCDAPFSPSFMSRIAAM